MKFVFRLCLFTFVLILNPNEGQLFADDASDDERFELSDDVQELFSPLFVAIKDAEVSRATVEVLSDSLLNGRMVESKKATYQIASKSPNKFTIYLKQPNQRTRVYNDGDSIAVALAPDAYFRLPEPFSNQEAITGLPFPMGPYPEPVLALTLAGVDPAASLVSGMKSIEIVGDHQFRGKIPSVQIHGVQADTVTWDLWLTKDDTPKPLRLLVDLTPMLLSSPELRLPKGYSQQLRFDFLSWRVTGKVDDSLFTFEPADDAKEYDSIDHYNQALAAAAALPPLLGKEMPEFVAATLNDGQVGSKDLADKVAVIDFWISSHQPCTEILSVIKSVCDRYAEKEVVFLAINVNEDEQTINAFLKKQKLQIPVVTDPDGSIAKTFKIDALPQTVVIGKNGRVESVHRGYPGKKELINRLTDELDVLTVGGTIATGKVDQPESEADNATIADDDE